MNDMELYIELSSVFYKTNDYSMLKRLVECEERPTAMVCFHDRIAIWAMQGLKQLGLHIPGDISITGFDNINELRYIEPKLTTVSMPTIEIAREAVAILVDNIQTKICGNKKVILQTELLQGRSCK